MIEPSKEWVPSKMRMHEAAVFTKTIQTEKRLDIKLFSI